MTTNAIYLKNLLEHQYRSFYDSYYGFADPSLRRERADILAKTGLGADVMLEPLVPYASSGKDFSEVAADLGLGEDVAQFVGALFGDLKLYVHQVNALEEYLAGRNTVTSAGTGSGKTESLVFALLDARTLLVGIRVTRLGWSRAGAKPLVGKRQEMELPANY
jgi:ATP-dependent helicase YprA (DUF1998 family)